MSKYVGVDTDGTKWVRVRFITEVDVMADEADDYAVELARLAVDNGAFCRERYEFVEMN